MRAGPPKTSASTRAEIERSFRAGWSLDRESSLPAYAQIESRVIELIESGALAVGDRLPAERDLSAWLRVSRMTVRQALFALADRGLVERGVGRGTFVAQLRVEHDLSRVAGFSEQMARHNLEPSAVLLAASVATATTLAAHELGIDPGAPTYRIQRVRFGSGLPLTLEDSWIPVEPFPGLLDHDLGGSLYALMRDEYALGPVRAVERLQPVSARPHEAESLHVESGAPLMLVERTALAADGTPVEFAHDRHRGDRARFVIDVTAHIPADV